MGVDLRHGGNRVASPRSWAVVPLSCSMPVPRLCPGPHGWGAPLGAIRDYPDRSHAALRGRSRGVTGWIRIWCCRETVLRTVHLWRDAAAAGVNLLLPQGSLTMDALCVAGMPTAASRAAAAWSATFPQCFLTGDAAVLWVCNPHNPTGWESRLARTAAAALFAGDRGEVFLPLVPDGERQSLIRSADHDNLVVRSLTKLFGIAGLRLGYVLTRPERLQRRGGVIHGPSTVWRPPSGRSCCRIRVTAAGAARFSSGRPMRGPGGAAQRSGWSSTPPLSSELLLLRGDHSLVRMRQELEQRHRILLRIAGPSVAWANAGCASVCRRGDATVGSWKGCVGFSPRGCPAGPPSADRRPRPPVPPYRCALACSSPSAPNSLTMVSSSAVPSGACW